MRRGLYWTAGLIGLVLVVSGCGGYRVGTLLPEHIKTIAVPVLTNETDEPNLEIAATTAVINQLNTDGTLRVVGEAHDPDVLLTVRIVNYQRKPIRYVGSTRPAEYRITITAVASLYDVRNQTYLFENSRVSGNTEFVIGGGLPASERRARPEALEDLAHDLVERIVEGW